MGGQGRHARAGTQHAAAGRGAWREAGEGNGLSLCLVRGRSRFRYPPLYQLSPNAWAKHGVKVSEDGVRRSAAELVGQHRVPLDSMRPVFEAEGAVWGARRLALAPRTGAVRLTPSSAPPRAPDVADEVSETLEIELHYSSYVQRQEADMERMRRAPTRSMKLPPDVDYSKLHGLRTEEVQKLAVRAGPAPPPSAGARPRAPRAPARRNAGRRRCSRPPRFPASTRTPWCSWRGWYRRDGVTAAHSSSFTVRGSVV